MKVSKTFLSAAMFLFITIFLRTSVAQSPVISKSTCDVGNLTIKERAPHDGRLVFVFNQATPNGFAKTNFRTVDQVNNYFGASATTELEAIDAICVPTRSLAEIVTFLQDTSGSVGTFTATVQAGGSITLEDGTQLSVPPGAVAQDIDITVETQGILNPLDQGGVALVRLSPDGLALLQPATLTVPVVVAPNFDLTQVKSVVFSTENPVLQDLGEFSIAQAINPVPAPAAPNTITLSLDHFSLVSLLFSPGVEIIPHLPPRFLQPGDLIFKLSGNAGNLLYLPNWLPGHVAVYIGSTDPNDLNQATVVEATPDPTQPNTCPTLPLAKLSFGRGVFPDPITTNFINSGTIYMGARRPLLTDLTPTMRSSITTFAEGIAHSSTEECYLPIGWPTDPGSTFWSCTKLAVRSYLSAGVTEFSPFRNNPAIPPYTLFKKMQPVKDLAVSAGETVQIPVSVVAKPLPLVPPLGFYAENPSGSTLTMSTSPIATLDPASRIITIAPTVAQACQQYPLSLTGMDPFGDVATLNMTIKVNDPSCPACDLSNPTVASITPITDALGVRDTPTIAPRAGGGWTVIYSDGSLQRVDVDKNANIVASLQLTNGSFPSGLTQTNPSLSDDGTVLSFQQSTSTTSGILLLLESDLLEMNPSGGGQTLIEAGGGSTFFFAPDGNLSGGPEVFSACLPNGSVEDNIIATTISPLGPVTPVQTLSSGFCDSAQLVRPHWDTKRSQITFGNNNQVFVGGSTVTTGENPDWSPNGQWLVFDDAGNITISTPGGANRKILATGTAPAWSADGCAITYVSNSNQIELLQLK